MARSPRPVQSDAQAVSWELEQEALKDPVPDPAVLPDDNGSLDQLPLDPRIMVNGKPCLVIDAQVWRDPETGEQVVEELGCSTFPPKLVVNF